MVGIKNQFKKLKKNSSGQLGQKAEFFISPLEKYQSNFRSYKSEKINSLARLTDLHIPTVPLPHYLKQDSYLYYVHRNELNPVAVEELKKLFKKIKSAGYNLTIRPSVFVPEVPGFEFIVPNAVNIPDFNELLKAIKTGYGKMIAETKRPEIVEFVYVIQGFYTSNRCGLAQTDDGRDYVHIEAAFGEHSMVITRGQVKPDIYKFNKKSGEIIIQEIAEKEFTLEPSKTGLIKVPLTGKERKRQVLNRDEIKTLVKYALLMDEAYGPQEIEWAVLRTGQIIFQATRNANLQKFKKAPTKNYPIFPKNVKGKLVSLLSETRGQELKKHLNLAGKIVITNNLDIDFITNLTSKKKPAGIILTRGSLTAHAVTIIREAKIPSVLAKDLIFENNQSFSANKKFAEIKEDGEIKFT